MANSYSYDRSSIDVRRLSHRGAVGPGTATAAGHLDTPVAAQLWNAHFTVSAAGTGAGAIFRVINVSGTTTTTIGSTTAGTSAIGSVLRLNALSTSSTITPTTLVADSVTYAITVADATLAGRVTWEYQADDAALFT